MVKSFIQLQIFRYLSPFVLKVVKTTFERSLALQDLNCFYGSFLKICMNGSLQGYISQKVITVIERHPCLCSVLLMQQKTRGHVPSERERCP